MGLKTMGLKTEKGGGSLKKAKVEYEIRPEMEFATENKVTS